MGGYVHQTTQNGILTRSGLLKSGHLMKCWKQEQERPVSEQRARFVHSEHTDRVIVIDDDDMDSNTATESDLSLIVHGHSCTG